MQGLYQRQSPLEVLPSSLIHSEKCSSVVFLEVGDYDTHEQRDTNQTADEDEDVHEQAVHLVNERLIN